MDSQKLNISELYIGLHIAKSVIFENNRLIIEEQKNAIQNAYNLLLTEFRVMVIHYCLTTACQTIIYYRKLKLM